MAFMKVLAGDIPEGEWVFTGWGDLAVMSRGFSHGGSVDLNIQLSSVEQVTEESAKRLAASTAWAAVGGLTFGPLGVLGGNDRLVGLPCVRVAGELVEDDERGGAAVSRAGGRRHRVDL